MTADSILPVGIILCGIWMLTGCKENGFWKLIFSAFIVWASWLAILWVDEELNQPTYIPYLDVTYDLDCSDVRSKVWVGDDDPHDLDRDGDGWGCE